MIESVKQILSRRTVRQVKPNRQNGQSLVEMAIAAPLLIFMMIGLFEVGWALRSYVVMVNVNREITRFAVRPGYLDFSTPGTVASGYQSVRDWVDTTLSGQLQLDFDDSSGDTTLIVSHVVVDTGLPCEDVITNPDGCDCEAFVSDPDYANNYTMDDMIIHPGMSSYEFQAQRFGPAATATGARNTRIEYATMVEELAANNNKFNCEVLKKGGVTSSNNVIITEIFHDQPQLFGFPFISNPLTDPVPLYTHTSMRLVCAARTNGRDLGNLACGVDTYGACMAYPITFKEDVLVPDPDNPDKPKPYQEIDAYEGDSPGNFGWITWNPDSAYNNADYVEEELYNPKLSKNDYTNVNDPSDHQLSIGDDVSTKPGVANSDGIDAELQGLVGREIIIPVYDNNPGTGENAYYHISHFARIRVDAICLPRNGKLCDGENKKQIKATFIEYVDDLCGGYNQSQTVCLVPTQDSYIRQDEVNNNYGADDDLKVKPDANKERHGAIAFDLASVPTGSDVLTATLSLYEDNKKDNQTISVHRLSESWVESEVTWNNSQTGTPWTVPGGDYDPAVLASFAPNVDNQYREIDVTGVTQGWVDGTLANHGLLLRSEGDNGEVKFKSKEEGNASKRPKLCVTYRQP